APFYYFIFSSFVVMITNKIFLLASFIYLNQLCLITIITITVIHFTNFFIIVTDTTFKHPWMLHNFIQRRPLLWILDQDAPDQIFCAHAEMTWNLELYVQH